MVCNDLRAAQLERRVRWVPETNLHLTVRFLGETTPTQVDAIVAGLSEAVRRHPPLRLVVSKLGCFPNDRSPRVVWLGLEGDLESLRRLHKDVEAAVQQVGYDPAPRALAPHLTIGRIRRGLPKPTLQALSARLKATSQEMAMRSAGETNRLDFEVRADAFGEFPRSGSGKDSEIVVRHESPYPLPPNVSRHAKADM